MPFPASIIWTSTESPTFPDYEKKRGGTRDHRCNSFPPPAWRNQNGLVIAVQRTVEITPGGRTEASLTALTKTTDSGGRSHQSGRRQKVKGRGGERDVDTVRRWG